MTNPLRLVQMTDLHLMASAEARFKGVDSRLNFLKGLALAQTLQPDWLILTGDLAQEEVTETYQWLAAQLHASGLRWQWLPGNHDDPLLMQAFCPTGFYLSQQGWQLLGLNSQSPGEVAGRLDQQELQRLDAALQQPQPLLLALHHHPLAVGSAWMDALALQQNEALWSRLDKASQPLVLLCGHVHQAAHWCRGAVEVYATPATSLQFAPEQAHFSLDLEAPPGLRWIDLYPEGHWETQIVTY